MLSLTLRSQHEQVHPGVDVGGLCVPGADHGSRRG